MRKRIRALLEEIHSDADPVLLNRCRSIFRQEVSYFRRSYMAAYLLLLAEGVPVKAKTGSRAEGKSAGGRKETGRSKVEKSRFSPRDRTESCNETSKPEEMKVLSEEESIRLFVSIGRNRKVFPREILALINAKAKVARDDIGMIRILDNYSFVQIRTSAAETVIQALNGQRFRGRVLTVNYARKREGEEETLPDGKPAND